MARREVTHPATKPGAAVEPAGVQCIEVVAVDTEQPAEVSGHASGVAVDFDFGGLRLHNFSSIYRWVSHHYHDRMGLEMPFTAQVVEKNRPEGWQTPFASWGTLLHAGLPVSEKAPARNR